MKNLFFVLLLITSLNTHAQNISGLYSGTLYNDTTKQTQTYELALSDYRGKITGYAYATFIVNDTFYYSIRRVKATKKEGELVVEDGDMLANNFPVRPDKGVRRITRIPLDHLSESDTLGAFSANWKTTPTKTFYSLPGTMTMKRDNDSARSSLMAHLTELKIIRQEEPAPQPAVAATPSKNPVKAPAKEKVSVEKEKPKKAENTAAAVIPYQQRQQKLLHTLEVQSDSLVLSFYDNGVVDGDIISVYLNGETIIANSKLLEVATKKTISLKTHTEAVELVLVAENLGSIPPNTGLLVVQDGPNKYEVRFSADLQTNAAIIFKKRK